MVKTKTMVSSIWAVALVSLLAIGVLSFALLGGVQQASVTGQVTLDQEGNIIGPWADKIVFHELSVKDKFSGADVTATAKVYSEQPADWGNPRGTFDDASMYTTYTASDGVVSIDDELPGTYYVVLTASDYNTEFVTITISDGTGEKASLSDYNDNPARQSSRMAQVGETTDVDFALTLVNDTSAEIEEFESLKLDDDTEFRGWKVIVNDEIGFSLDSDGNGVFDEGIKTFTVTVNGKTETIFDPARGIDKFDSNDEYTFSLEGVVKADGDRLDVEIEMDAITHESDTTGNDEQLGEGEGIVSYIKIYDLEGNLFATMDVTA